MKRTVIFAICLIGLLAMSSCRSTSSPCGLADSELIKNDIVQSDALV